MDRFMTNKTRLKAISDISPEFLDILDALPFYVLLVDSAHYILHANKTVQLQLGLDPDQIVGGYCPKVIHGIDTKFYGCPLEESVEKGEGVEREVFDENSGRWLNSAIYPTNQYTKKEKRIYLHMVTDITERKKGEEQLRASHEELQSLSAHMETLREEEKRRIARDLHDETAQVVASLSAHLQAAINLLPGTAVKAKTLLNKAQGLSVSILDELHKVIYELHPLLLDDLGLVEAIGSLIDNLKTPGVNMTLKIRGTVIRLPLQRELILFRVIQEALSNIIRHASAKNVVVNFRFLNDYIKVRIIDDGIGFDIEKATEVEQRPRGFGILGMKERMELIDGTLNIFSHPGKGTVIELTIPLAEEAK